MNSIIRTGVVVLLVVAAILFYASTFVVSQTQQALVLQFGRVRTVANETGKNAPGLYFKWPFIENVVTLEKRVLDLDLPVQTILSADRQNLEVDAFARYRISNRCSSSRPSARFRSRTSGSAASSTPRCATSSPTPRATRSCAPSAPI